ncbi:MAG: hypothetical protein IKT43_00465 [Clostridia bacterium]|nr:hypothetical protein [Clostridia bacterium]
MSEELKNTSEVQEETLAAKEATAEESTPAEEVLPAEDVMPEQETDTAPIPMPILSEGFRSGNDDAPKKKSNKKVVFVSVILTVAVLFCAFVAASFFIKDVDLLHIFHPAIDTQAAEEVALASYNTFYRDCDLDAFFALFPEKVRDSYAAQFCKQNGFATLNDFKAALLESYNEFSFGEATATMMMLYTDDGIRDLVENDVNTPLFGSDYTAESIDAVCQMKLVFSYSYQGGEEQLEQSGCLLAMIDGQWFLIQ